MITGVTITGADDRVDPAALLRLSDEFPFVEWGVLVSAKRTGSPRYPTSDWIWRLARHVGRHSNYKLAAHFCGQVARETLDGNADWIRGLPHAFRRIQLNGWTPGSVKDGFHHLGHGYTLTHFIFQIRDVASIPAAYDDAHRLRNSGGAFGLFDPSGGSGLAPAEWPHAPSDFLMGFAGGITPSTVVSVIESLGERPPYWLDMESGVRTNDQFDLEKVRAVLVATAPYIMKSFVRR